jgi:outer membrane protein assembly factor BamA
MRKLFIAFLFLAVFAPAAFCEDADASEQEHDGDASVVKIEHGSILLPIISWPFVHIIQPAAEFLMYPIIPPLIYVSRENLIEKGQNLITYGEDRQIMFYPLANAKLGSASNIGFAYRHENLFLKNDYIFFSPHLYINADWDAIVRYQKSRIMGSSFFGEFNASYKEYGSNSFRDPNSATYFFADSSLFLSSAIGFGFAGNWALKFTQRLNFLRFNLPSLDEEVFSGDEVSNRGFYKHFNAFSSSLSLHYNSMDAPYAATKGQKFDLGYSYTPVSAYNGSKDHNYHAVESRFAHYLLLGKKNYAMTVAESEANRERLKNLSFKEAIEIFNPMNIREEILDRRVLITQIKASYMIEENKGKAPFTAMGRLGDNYPLRAYPSGHFTAPFVAGYSNEYRWPIDIYADALIFNEYGIYSYDLKSISLSNLKNSYGLGFRVRTPKLFILRFALAFHGLQGVALILTTRPEYD